VILIVQMRMVRKALNIHKMLSLGINYVIAGLVMFVAVSFEAKLLESSIINTLIIAFSGVIVYCLMLLVLRDSLFMDTAKAVLSKIQKPKKSD